MNKIIFLVLIVSINSRAYNFQNLCLPSAQFSFPKNSDLLPSALKGYPIELASVSNGKGSNLPKLEFAEINGKFNFRFREVVNNETLSDYLIDSKLCIVGPPDQKFRIVSTIQACRNKKKNDQYKAALSKRCEAILKSCKVTCQDDFGSWQITQLLLRGNESLAEVNVRKCIEDRCLEVKDTVGKYTEEAQLNKCNDECWLQGNFSEGQQRNLSFDHIEKSIVIRNEPYDPHKSSVLGAHQQKIRELFNPESIARDAPNGISFGR